MISAVPASLTNEQRLLLRFRRMASVPRLRSMLEFAEQEIVIPNGPFSGRKLKADRQPYLKALCECFSGPWRRKVATGPSQSGKTLSAFVLPVMYHLFEVGETVICGLPSIEMAKDKWEQDLLPVIERSRYVELLPRKGSGSRGGIAESITFANGTTLRFMGGQGGKRGDKQRSAFTSRVVVITETDGLDTASATSQEADPISQLEARTRSYGKRACIYMECTVSTNEGRTWREYEAGTQSRLIVPCVHCGAWVTPEREHLMGWESADTKLAAGSAAFFACPSCGERWEDRQREDMNRRMRVIHRGQEVTSDGQIVGDPIETDTLGFRWNAFNNLFASTDFLGEESWLAKNIEGDGVSATKALKQFIWCEPVKDETIERADITVGIVRGSARGYEGRCDGRERGQVPDGCQYITCFIDIGKRFLPWQVVGWVGDSAYVIDYGMYETMQPDVVGDEVAIKEALNCLKVALEERWKINVGLVDSGNWSQLIRAIVREWGMPWFCAEGVPGYQHPPRSTSERKVSHNGARFYQHRVDKVIRHDPDWGKTRCHSQYMLKPLDDDKSSQRSGACFLFGSDPLDHNEFAMQVTAEVFERRWEDGKGYKEAWNKIRKNNHYLDCHVGNMLARKMEGFFIVNDGGLLKRT